MQDIIVNLISIVSLLLALSMASERLVEIIKGVFPFLNEEQKTDLRKEGWRRAALHILAVIAGIFTARLASPVIANLTDSVSKNGSGQSEWTHILAFGLLASGGSSLWNSVLTYLLSVKDIKGLDAEKKKQDLRKEIAPSPGPGAGAGAGVAVGAGAGAGTDAP